MKVLFFCSFTKLCMRSQKWDRQLVPFLGPCLGSFFDFFGIRVAEAQSFGFNETLWLMATGRATVARVWRRKSATSEPASTPKSFGPASATGNSTALAATGKAPAGALWPEAYGNQTTWKVPPTSPPKTLQQAGASSGIGDAREYHKKWQDRPYDPNDDHWIECVADFWESLASECRCGRCQSCSRAPCGRQWRVDTVTSSADSQCSGRPSWAAGWMPRLLEKCRRSSSHSGRIDESGAAGWLHCTCSGWSARTQTPIQPRRSGQTGCRYSLQACCWQFYQQCHFQHHYPEPQDVATDLRCHGQCSCGYGTTADDPIDIGCFQSPPSDPHCPKWQEVCFASMPMVNSTGASPWILEQEPVGGIGDVLPVWWFARVMPCLDMDMLCGSMLTIYWPGSIVSPHPFGHRCSWSCFSSSASPCLGIKLRWTWTLTG